MTALSVGYIQTYRDSVDSLGESVDMSIKVKFNVLLKCIDVLSLYRAPFLYGYFDGKH